MMRSHFTLKSIRWAFVASLAASSSVIFASSPAAACSTYSAVGAIASSDERNGVALLLCESNKRVFAVRSGETFAPNSKVEKVEPGKVTLLLSGRSLILTTGGESSATASSSIAAHGAAFVSTGEGVELRGNTAVVSTSYRDHLIKNQLSKVLMQMAAVPHYSASGQLTGFTLLNIDPGSVYEQVGLRNSDTVTAINDQPITDVAQAIRLLNALKDADQVNLKMLRNGQPTALKIEVK